MKWKMTSRFLMTVLSIVFIVIIVNIVLLGVYLTVKSQDRSDVSLGENVIYELLNYIEYDDNKIVFTEQALDHLQNNNSWVQILDKNGNVVDERLTENLTLPRHYSPVELIQNYKYREVDQDTTVFIAEAGEYSALVGVKDPNLSRNVLTLDGNYFVTAIGEYLLLIIIVDILVAIIAGLLFGAILTKPLYRMIERIQQLKNQNYSQPEKQKHGIYKNVFNNLDEVAQDLKMQEEERSKLEKMRNDWVSNVSHDMKTPLASIRGYAELLKDSDVHENERKSYAEVIERQSKYMNELLEDFMLTLRLRNAELPLSTETVAAEKFMRAVVIDFLNDAQFGDYDVDFESNTSAKINVDTHLMKRAILNFLINACIHNPPTTKVQVTLTEVNNELVITVQDDGNGIKEEDLPNIFERYYRGTSTTDVQGSGLGMAISRDICTAHGGKVQIDSKEAIGTIITITLPVASED